MTLGGKDNADRVARLCARAREVMEAGHAALAKAEGPCACFYDDGSPRYTTGKRKPAHRCGR